MVTDILKKFRGKLISSLRFQVGVTNSNDLAKHKIVRVRTNFGDKNMSWVLIIYMFLV